MSIIDLIALVVVIGFLGVIVYVANQEETQTEPSARGAPALNVMLYAIIGLTLLFALLTLQTGVFSVLGPSGALDDVGLPAVDAAAAVVNFGLAVIAGFFAVRLINSAALRARLKQVTGPDSTYNPESAVHTAAAVLSLALLSFSIGQLVLSGGLAGLAESFELQQIDAASVLFNQLLWVLFALLGVGLFIRRNPAQTLERLGLRWPTREDITWGIGTALALFAFIYVLGIIWALLVTPEQFAEQTAASQQIAQSFGSLPVAFVLALAIGFGEEVFFRGALQPVFGLGLTSVFFALLHTQYTLTPATIAIFVVSVGLGRLRARHSTTAAVIAHFLYNFIQLALAILATSVLGGQ
ncbi:MAG: CPBP family intramembrane metalloprotease [Chloroflexi bacterium]|nr:CPBP family intramembrane metalloprotease [Chloroflexota bacterium]